MNMKTLQFLSGVLIAIFGLRCLIYDTPQYLLGTGFIVWGVASILLAWVGRNGGDGKSRNEQILGVIYLVGLGLTMYGLFFLK